MSVSMPANRTPDQKTFEKLYKQGRDRLLASITGMVRDRDRAEDITAAAFEKAWEKRAQFRGDSSLGTWLYAIGLNAARQSWRQERSVDQDPMDRLETARYAEPDRLSARLEEDEVRAFVWKALDRVPAKYRRLLIDRYVNGRSVQEIARREGVPIGTVGSRLFTARGMLREAWRAPTSVGGAMQEEKVREITDEALKRLVDELKTGRSEALTQYLAAMGRFHRYSWGNVLLINAQRPTATRVAGFHAWRQLERSVKKGEKGIMIFAPIVVKNREATPSQDVKPNDALRVAGFRSAYVFDVEQTQGRPLPAFARTGGDPKDFGDKLKAIIAERGIAVTYDASIAPADGLSSGGQIRIRPGLSPAEEFSVLAHELAHEMLHHGPDRGTMSKVVRETQAEAVAFVVSRGIGLETRSAAADYIALYNGDANTLTESLATIQKASSQILSDLLPEDRAASAPARTPPPETAHPRSPDESRRSRATDSASEQVPAGPDPVDSMDR